MSQTTNGFYAIIPSEVRHSKELSPSEKLLYAELSALSNQKGYCWATNQYLADLYNVHKNTISAWISKLETLGFLQTQLIMDGKRVIERRIYVTDFLQCLNQDSQENQDGSENKGTNEIQPTHENQGGTPNVISPTNENRVRPIKKNVLPPIREILKENSIRVNNTRLNNKEYIQEKFFSGHDQPIFDGTG